MASEHDILARQQELRVAQERLKDIGVAIADVTQLKEQEAAVLGVCHTFHQQEKEFNTHLTAIDENLREANAYYPDMKGLHWFEKVRGDLRALQRAVSTLAEDESFGRAFPGHASTAAELARSIAAFLDAYVNNPTVHTKWDAVHGQVMNMQDALRELLKAVKKDEQQAFKRVEQLNEQLEDLEAQRQRQTIQRLK